ncbi:MAG: uracil-DNA glycosylase [Candidatus Electrothrix scaldis]|nr:MAG: uracil-DNA glycosylase [Candidatus Electrothrix sp. GW3-3]
MSAEKRAPDQSSDRKRGKKTDPASLALLTAQVRHLLAFHKEIGLTTYPAAPQLRQFLTRAQKPQPSSYPQEQKGKDAYPLESTGMPEHRFEKAGERARPGRTASPSPQPQVRKENTPPAKAAVESIQQSLKVLNQEIMQCPQCSSRKEVKKVLGLGSLEPRLLIVGDYCADAESTAATQLIWGEEEDAMLWRMMTAIGLEQDGVYVTNAMKCVQPSFDQANSSVELPCLSFLEKELQILRPRLICAMGDIATRALLKTKAPLARVRGRFHTYKYPQGGVAKVMPTFHPRLLLQYPEMKQATWKDLQAVQKALQAQYCQ